MLFNPSFRFHLSCLIGLNPEGERELINYILKPQYPNVTSSEKSSLASITSCPHSLLFLSV